MSGLLDEIRGEKKVRSRSPKMDAAYASLSAEQRADLLEALADDSIASAAIARVLTRRGTPIGETTVRAARKNGWRPNESA